MYNTLKSLPRKTNKVNLFYILQLTIFYRFSMNNIERRRSTDYSESCPKYGKHELSKEQMLELVEMVAEKVLDVSIDKTIDRIDQRRNEQIGKMVTNKFYAALGAIVFTIWAWLTHNGYLK